MRPDYLKPYHEVLERVGPRFESLLWTSRDNQTARFRAIAEMTDLRARSLLDLGCGHADLLRYLRAIGSPPARYTGIDAIPEMLDAARTAAPSDDATAVEFHALDFVTQASAVAALRPFPEVVVFSGSLNTLRQEHALAALEVAWLLCSHALVFNFLPEHRPDRLEDEQGPAHRFDTMAMIHFALERTPLVQFRQDYLEGMDATILMRVQ